MKKVTLLASLALVCMSVSLGASAQNADTLYFYKGGQIITKMPIAEIDSFTFTPQAPVSQGYGIDLAMTAQYGGMIYNASLKKHSIYVYNQGVKVYVHEEKQWLNFPWSQIKSNWKELSEGISFKLYYDKFWLSDGLNIIGFMNNTWAIWPIVSGEFSTANVRIWEDVGGPHINATITQNPDKSVTITDGKDTSTAKEW